MGRLLILKVFEMQNLPIQMHLWDDSLRYEWKDERLKYDNMAASGNLMLTFICFGQNWRPLNHKCWCEHCCKTKVQEWRYTSIARRTIWWKGLSCIQVSVYLQSLTFLLFWRIGFNKLNEKKNYFTWTLFWPMNWMDEITFSFLQMW